ncbi:MAG TPA: 3-hydroxyacyl-CoA dehydrogenase NAD-binding domain-containing protein [Candidatus Angelobacter sp.]
MAEIRTVAVIGAGIAGRRIAHALVLAGYRTVLEDILPASLRKAQAEMRAGLEQALKQGQVRKAEAEEALARLVYASTVEEAARQADLVIEAVPDELESKLEIFTLLDKICKPQTILASSTTSLSITEIASITYRRRKCIGMRFTPAGTAMPQVEIIRGQETDEDTVAACLEVERKIGGFLAANSRESGGVNC